MRNPFKKKEHAEYQLPSNGEIEKADKEKAVEDGQYRDDENKERGNWSAQLDFTLSCVGYAVGLGNLWRFPYLCMRNGGGAFLFPYFLFLFLCGMPLFFLELVIGQFSSLSPLAVWKICPLFSGLGWGMVVVSTIVCVYYNIIIAWVLYYLGKSFISELPWASCGQWWNTILCNERGKTPINGTNITSLINGTEFITYIPGKEEKLAEIRETLNMTFNATVKLRTPAEEFWQFEVLQMTGGIGELGGIRWQLVLCLLGAWLIIFFCLFKGVKSSGKVVYVTATAPYIILTILLIRGLLLPGAIDGIRFYVTPDFSRLLEFKVWGEACLQIFYSLGPAWGGLIAMASYNKFNNNCLKDAVIVCLCCSGTSFYAGFVIFSVIGFMAKEAGEAVEDVITQGPGLAFVAYPEAITKLPISPIWAILFFVMLLTLGLDSQFGMMETLVSGFVDQFPKLLKRRKTLFTALVCTAEFIFGILFVTRAGMYYFQVVDWYCAAFSVMVIALLECVTVAWIYGVDRLYDDIEMMLKKRPNIFWKICWCYITPGMMVVIIIFSCFQMDQPTYGKYIYPNWAIGLGWLLAMCSIIPIPAVAVYKLLQEEGTLRERISTLLKCSDEWGPALSKHYNNYKYALHNRNARAMQPLVGKPPVS